MNAVMNSITSRKLEKAVEAAKWLPLGPERLDSRTAPKFVIRAYTEMFAEMERLAGLHLRSRNSEVILAIIDSIDGRTRSTLAIETACHYLGESASEKILAEVPVFTLDSCRDKDRFVIRFPAEVRETMFEVAGDEGSETGIAWVIDALVYWINAQRKQHALYTAISIITANAGGN